MCEELGVMGSVFTARSMSQLAPESMVTGTDATEKQGRKQNCLFVSAKKDLAGMF